MLFNPHNNPLSNVQITSVLQIKIPRVIVVNEPRFGSKVGEWQSKEAKLGPHPGKQSLSWLSRSPGVDLGETVRKCSLST